MAKAKKKKSKKTWNLKTLLIQRIRQIWMYSPHRRVILERAKVGSLYRCNICKSLEKRDFIHVDHNSPVVPTTGFAGWDAYINAMFDGVQYAEKGVIPEGELKNLQAVCESCHSVKTAIESDERKLTRKKKNK